MSTINTTLNANIDVLVIGELNVDLILQGNVTPTFGQAEKLIDDATLTLGSSSAIFACGVARLGLNVAFIGKVGDDEFGHFVLNALQKRAVNTDGIIIDPNIKTGLSVILSQGDDRAILTYAGSIAALHSHEIDFTFFACTQHLHLGSYFLLDKLRADIPTIFQKAQAEGLTTSLDTNYDPSEKWNDGLSHTLAHTDIFLPNQTELQAITKENNLKTALNRLAQTVPLIATKLGADGAIAQCGANVIQAPPLPVNVIDTTGAGDSFDAGFIYGYLAGWSLPRILRFGCICGALSTQAAGGITAQPTLTEALAMFS